MATFQFSKKPKIVQICSAIFDKGGDSKRRFVFGDRNLDTRFGIPIDTPKSKKVTEADESRKAIRLLEYHIARKSNEVTFGIRLLFGLAVLSSLKIF